MAWSNWWGSSALIVFAKATRSSRARIRLSYRPKTTAYKRLWALPIPRLADDLAGVRYARYINDLVFEGATDDQVMDEWLEALEAEVDEEAESVTS